MDSRNVTQSAIVHTRRSKRLSGLSVTKLESEDIGNILSPKFRGRSKNRRSSLYDNDSSKPKSISKSKGRSKSNKRETARSKSVKKPVAKSSTARSKSNKRQIASTNEEIQHDAQSAYVDSNKIASRSSSRKRNSPSRLSKTLTAPTAMEKRPKSKNSKQKALNSISSVMETSPAIQLNENLQIDEKIIRKIIVNDIPDNEEKTVYNNIILDNDDNKETIPASTSDHAINDQTVVINDKPKVNDPKNCMILVDYNVLLALIMIFTLYVVSLFRASQLLNNFSVANWIGTTFDPITVMTSSLILYSIANYLTKNWCRYWVDCSGFYLGFSNISDETETIEYTALIERSYLFLHCVHTIFATAFLFNCVSCAASSNSNIHYTCIKALEALAFGLYLSQAVSVYRFPIVMARNWIIVISFLLFCRYLSPNIIDLVVFLGLKSLISIMVARCERVGTQKWCYIDLALTISAINVAAWFSIPYWFFV